MRSIRRPCRQTNEPRRPHYSLSSERDFEHAKRVMASLDLVDLGGQHIAIQAAKNTRTLRALGVTVRKTIDTIIATRCIEDGLTLLYSDRDFQPFVQHLGLRSAMEGA